MVMHRHDTPATKVLIGCVKSLIECKKLRDIRQVKAVNGANDYPHGEIVKQ